MAETFTLEEVGALLNTVVSGIRTGSVEDRVFTLEEVAARTGWALDTLEEDCRAGRLQHTKRGRKRGMTSSQIADAIHQHTVGVPLADQIAALASRNSGVRPGNARRRAA
ncbi:hypothetical protein ACQP2Y_21975 [Actinoplanes sp. CA-051413]|uniref:hypothetical protein n=1 Tax=Actinoplanes sp. CA-051413 TaxID=3239899 RepID=UPI003D99FD8B